MGSSQWRAGELAAARAWVARRQGQADSARAAWAEAATLYWAAARDASAGPRTRGTAAASAATCALRAGMPRRALSWIMSLQEFDHAAWLSCAGGLRRVAHVAVDALGLDQREVELAIERAAEKEMEGIEAHVRLREASRECDAILQAQTPADGASGTAASEPTLGARGR